MNDFPATDPAAPVAEGSSGEGGAREFKLRKALEEMVRRRASDLHLKVGRNPVIRLHGELVESDLGVLRPEDLKRVSEQLLSPLQLEEFAVKKEIDFAVGVQGLGRFRVNLFQQRGTYGFAFRAIPFEIPSMRDLQLPDVVQDIALSPRGLVLVTGITGSGKSTTLAAMLRYMNEHRSLNIVTIEDPIEFLHRDLKSMISPRRYRSIRLWSKVCMPYWVRPSAMRSGRVCIWSPWRSRSATAAVFTRISAAGARPAPSARGMSRMEMTARSASASSARISPCWCGGKKETMRLTVCATSVVCSVESTRWPVFAALSTVSIDSRSRISPSITTSGSCRSTWRSASWKERVSFPTSRWLIIARTSR